MQQNLSSKITILTKPDKAFAKACEKVGIATTRRQYSKWQAKKGLAWKRGR